MPYNLDKAKRMNPILVPQLRKSAPESWPPDLASKEFADRVYAFQIEAEIEADGIYGKNTHAAFEHRVLKTASPSGLFSFEGGLLRANPNHALQVNVLHLQTRKCGVRKAAASGAAISFIVNHVSAFERPKFTMDKLAAQMSAAKLSPTDQARLRSELAGSPTFPGALYQCLNNEADDSRQASWDFMVETKGDEINIVQYNCDIAGHFAWHAAPSKKKYLAQKSGVVVKNKEGAITWDGKAFLPPALGINGKSIGIENSFYCGPCHKSGDRVIYEWNGKGIDITDRGPFVEVDGKLFQRASERHLKVLAALNGALCDAFHIPISGIIGHYIVDPVHRVYDPWVTIAIEDLRQMASQG